MRRAGPGVYLAMVTLTAVTLARPQPMQAQSVPYAGFTNGCFGLGCVPVSSNVFQTAVLGGLTYQNSTFSGTTIGGFAAIGNNAAGLGMRELDNLGAFYLTSAPFTYTGSSFTLLVTFTVPGNAMLQYQAALTGQIQTGKKGGVFIDFDNTPQTFSYVNGATSGTVTLEVNDLSLIAPEPGGLRSDGASGNLLATAIVSPEPSSLLLIGSGMLGLVGTVRVRRRYA